MRFRWARHFLLLLSMGCTSAWAGTAAFDLPGPQIEVRVTRSGKTLPISQVTNLQSGDRIWVHPVLPAEQGVHYLLIAAFLRGATNPPPENWFTRAETWKKQVREEGIVLTIPQGAQQVLLFLAPETGGDFGSLRAAVRGKPGAFVRASQDLERASLDRSRLDAYLEAVRKTSDTEPSILHERSVLLARSLNIKLDEQCFDKPSEQQAPCLTENTDQLVLEDVHTQSMVSTLTSGAGSDLIGQLSVTKAAGGGAYSPYVGAIVDMARMLENFHSAEYQYIPALAIPKGQELNLKLNNPPSFHKPMSVLVIGLPAVEPAEKPPLRPIKAAEQFCLQKPSLVLPVEGAPLVFSTKLAHDFVLHVKSRSGQDVDLPATADSAQGGFVIDTQKLHAANLDPASSGTLRGYWGFQPLEGPSFQLRSAHPIKWGVPAADQTVLIVGRDDTLHLQSDSAVCVERVSASSHDGKPIPANWKASKPGELEVQVSLKDQAAGPINVLVKQYGLAEADSVSIQAYAEVGRLDDFRINVGDSEGTLRGTRLDGVAGLDLKGVHFTPGALARANGRDELRLSASRSELSSLQPGEVLTAHVSLKDGRSVELTAAIDPPRPRITLVSKNIDPGPTASAIRLGSPDQLPHDGRLSFFLKSEMPEVFPRDEKIEVAAESGSFSVVLSLENGSLILEDAQSVLAELDPRKSFGPSAFGPLHFRAVQGDGRKSDWQPLAILVRLPSLTEVRCPSSADQPCVLSGSNLFLLDSVASDPEFAESVSVPLGLVSPTINVPRPAGGNLYVKLRDDPSVISVAVPPTISRNSPSNGEERANQGVN